MSRSGICSHTQVYQHPGNRRRCQPKVEVLKRLQARNVHRRGRKKAKKKKKKKRKTEKAVVLVGGCCRTTNLTPHASRDARL
jgi:S-methylmethionine-dependent homocysteine/selenocysteine methylase